MTVAIRDAYRTIVVTTGTGSGGLGGVSTANSPASTFQLDGGFGISLVYDNVNNKVTIVNTGNGTGALTTITERESLGTYYPVFSRAPTAGDINGVTGTYQLDTMYIEQTAQPLTYNPGTGLLSSVGLILSGTLTVGSTTLIGSAASLTRFPNALAVISNTASGIQQNESHNIGLMAEGTANSSNTAIYGVGVYGVGYTAGATRSGGVIGEGHVSATGDAGSAIGVRGYANDTHAGGMNIGLYGDATNGSANYALYLNNGGVYNNFALTWTMNGNITFSGVYAVTVPTLNLTNALDVAYGGTGTATASITAFNNITGLTAVGTTGTTSTNLVFSTSPTLVTPTLGAATATSINKMAITAPTSSSTLAVADGKTFTVSNTITLAGTDSTTITLPSTTGTVALNNQTLYIGTTSIAINRTSASQNLTGITSIDGYAAGLAGGNATTLLGSLPYQSAVNTTTLLSPNVTTTKKFLRMTGDGTNGTAPAWDTIVAGDIPTLNQNTTGSAGSATKATNLVGGNATTLLGSIHYQSAVDTTTLLSPNITTTKNFLAQTGDGTNGAAPVWNTSTGTGSVVLGTNPSITAPTSGNASSTNDADATVDASTTEFYAYVQSASGTARTINISNLTTGRKITLYLRNTNAATKTINIAASTTTTSFVAVNLSNGAGAISVTSTTLAASSGTAVVVVFNANGTIGGGII